MKFKISVRHEKMHQNGSVKCDECNIRFTPKALAFHKRLKHQEIENTEASRRCKICKATFKPGRMGKFFFLVKSVKSV